MRQERHECETSPTLTTRVQHETRPTRVRRKCDTNGMNATQVKNVDFDNDTSKNIFLHLYIYYMASEGLQGEEQFHSKN